MHLGTVRNFFLASIFHSEKLGSAQVQLGFSAVQPAEPKLNLRSGLQKVQDIMLVAVQMVQVRCRGGAGGARAVQGRCRLPAPSAPPRALPNCCSFCHNWEGRSWSLSSS